MNFKFLMVGSLFLLVNSVLAENITLPKLKNGLWESETTSPMPNMPVQKSQVCMDQATQEEMTGFAKKNMAGVCDEPKISQNGNTYSVETSCKFGGQAFSSTSKMTKVDEEHYTQEVIPSMGPKITSKTTFLGNCPDTMKPGDMKTADGKIMTSEDLKKMMEMAKTMGQAQVAPKEPVKIK